MSEVLGDAEVDPGEVRRVREIGAILSDDVH